MTERGWALKLGTPQNVREFAFLPKNHRNTVKSVNEVTGVT